MKKYEVPFNFDLDYAEKLSQHIELFDHIDCIYLPAWKEDCRNTRQDVTFRDSYPKTWDEYLLRLKMLAALGLDLCILAQRGATIETVRKYYDLGVRHFIVADDVLAGQARAVYGADVKLTLSVTRALTFEQIQNGDFSDYDAIVLFYWFNRHIEELKKLPTKNKYILMCNNDCYYDCKWHDAHWFATGETLEEYGKKANAACEKCRAAMNGELRKEALITPENLEYFDPYIETYKLVDRLWSTDRIIEALHAYIYRNVGTEKQPEEYFEL